MRIVLIATLFVILLFGEQNSTKAIFGFGKKDDTNRFEMLDKKESQKGDKPHGCTSNQAIKACE